MNRREVRTVLDSLEYLSNMALEEGIGVHMDDRRHRIVLRTIAEELDRTRSFLTAAAVRRPQPISGDRQGASAQQGTTSQ